MLIKCAIFAVALMAGGAAGLGPGALQPALAEDGRAGSPTAPANPSPRVAPGGPGSEIAPDGGAQRDRPGAVERDGYRRPEAPSGCPYQDSPLNLLV